MAVLSYIHLALCPLWPVQADNTTVLSQPSVEASSGKFFPGVTGRIALKGSNFDKNITTLYFDPPASDHVIRVREFRIPYSHFPRHFSVL